MKKNILKIASLSLIIVSMGAFSSDYIFNVGLKKEPKIINKIDDSQDKTPLKTYQYVDFFDTSKSGYGTYSTDKRTVTMPSSGKYSSPTDIITKTDIIKEARFKFKTVSPSGGANGISFFDSENNLKIVLWYNYDDNIYVYDQKGGYKKYIGGSGTYSDIMELRYNMDTGGYQFYINDVLKSEGTTIIKNVNSVYGKIFEGSNSVSTTTLIPEEN